MKLEKYFKNIFSPNLGPKPSDQSRWSSTYRALFEISLALIFVFDLSTKSPQQPLEVCNTYSETTLYIYIYIIIIMSVQPKGRSFTASGETYAAVLPKAGLPPLTQEPRLQLYQGFNMCGSFSLLSAPHSLFSIWIDLKRSQGHQRGGEESG